MSKWLIRFLIWFLVAIVAWINLQPWFSVGHWLAGSALEVPFQSTLLGWPVFRQVTEFLLINAAHLIAVSLWVCVQTLQIMALMAESDRVLSGFAWVFKGFPLSKWVTENAEILSRLGWMAYGLEGLVCFLAYPPYGEGMEDFIDDFWFWDSYLWNFGEIALIAATILMFEAVIFLVCFVASGVLPAVSTRRPQVQGGSARP